MPEDKQQVTPTEKTEMTEVSPWKDKGTSPSCSLNNTPANKQLPQQDKHLTGNTGLNPQILNGKPSQVGKGKLTSSLQLHMSRTDRVKLTPHEDDRTNYQSASPKELL